MSEFYTRAEVAKILGMSPQQAGRIMDQMPTLHVGKRNRRVSKRDFEQWCRDNTNPPVSKKTDPIMKSIVAQRAEARADALRRQEWKSGFTQGREILDRIKPKE